jgi:hypothetical protein|tara:strand:- start:290 stop:472 length:183 start_codon:yes stop_codon:yes gene_type:complete
MQAYTNDQNLVELTVKVPASLAAEWQLIITDEKANPETVARNLFDEFTNAPFQYLGGADV